MTNVLERLNDNRRLINLIRKNQIFSFILFTLFFSYLIGVPFNIWIREFSAVTTGFTEVYLQRVVTVYGPGLAAITIIYIADGKGGIKSLLQTLRPKRKHWKWYLLLPLISSIITFSSFLIGGVSFNILFSIIADNWILLIGHLILQSLIIGIGEELGWRGWLLPKLADKYVFAISILLVAIIWGLWHFPILFNGPAIVIPWLMMLFSFSIIFTWIWLKVKGDISVLVIAHASANSPQFFLENVLSKDYSQIILHSWEISGYIYLTVGGFFLFFMRKFLNKPLKIKN